MTRLKTTFISFVPLFFGLSALGCDDTQEDSEKKENTKALCSDDKDNDNNGHIDCDDAACANFCADSDSEEEYVDVPGDERHMLLRDEGNSLLHYVSLTDPSEDWQVEIPEGRDIQLVGDGRVMIGTETGYQEHDIKTGELVDSLDTFKGTIAARRLRNGNTLLVGTDWQGGKGIVLVEVDSDGEVVHTIGNADYDYARLVRETPNGTFLVTSNTKILELDEDGELIWEGTVSTAKEEAHAWMAIRLASGETVVTCGYDASLQIFDEDGESIQRMGGLSEAKYFFFSGLQILKNGNFIVSNWQGHGTDNGESGHQIVELNRDGELVWSWVQDPKRFSSIQAHIVIDGLDLQKLHVENEDGVLAPVE